MLIRRQVFFSEIDENGEERLYSVNEKKEKSNGDKVKTAGKVALAAGAGTALAGGITENIVADKVLRKAADKYGLMKEGIGASSKLWGLRKNVNKAVKVSERAIKGSKAFRAGKVADVAGTGLALAGTGAIVAGKIMNKKKKDDK